MRHMQHNYRICDFENATICEKICDMRVFAKYAIAYVIAYSHITSIPTQYAQKCHGHKTQMVTPMANPHHNIF